MYKERGGCILGDFEWFLEFYQEMAEATLEIVRKFKREKTPKTKRAYKLKVVERFLRTVGRPLHISEIIGIAQTGFSGHHGTRFYCFRLGEKSEVSTNFYPYCAEHILSHQRRQHDS